MKVSAKFTCTSIQKTPSEEAPTAATVKFLAVQDVEESNRAWAKATPDGEIRMAITNMEAVGGFQVGKSYFVDFTPADAVKGSA
jgi:hypothetical protein